MWASVELFLICGLPLLLVVALAIVTTRLRFRLGDDYTGWVLAGALVGGPAIWVAMALLGSLLWHELAEYDFLMNLILVPVGSLLGAGTTLLIILLRGHERTMARNVLVLLLPSLILSVLGLMTEFRSLKGHTPSNATVAYWLGIYGLPVMWLAVLWLVWCGGNRRKPTP